MGCRCQVLRHQYEVWGVGVGYWGVGARNQGVGVRYGVFVSHIGV